MPVILEYLDEGRIIKLTVSDPWRIEDLTSLYSQEQSYFDNAPHKVHTLLDIRAMYQIPPGALSNRNSPNVTHPNSGQVAIVGATTFAQVLIEIAFRLVRFDRVRFFEIEVEAKAYLDELIAIEQPQ